MTTTRVTARPLASPLAHAIDRMTTLARALDEGMPATAGASPTWIPALELAERADAYLIAAELPGVREDAIELSFENNVLTIRGTKAGLFEEARDGSLRRHLVERQTGAFQRAVRLPEYVEGDRIEARYVDGVLQVVVPKSPAAQPRRIPVARPGADRAATTAEPTSPAA